MNRAPSGSRDLSATPPVGGRDAVQRWRLVLARAALDPDAAGRELQAAWDAALAGCGLPVAGLDGPRARPRWALAAPLAAAIPGEAELLDVWLSERRPAWQVREAVRGVVPPGWRLVDAYDAWVGEPALPGQVAASVYRATIRGTGPDCEALEHAAGRMLAVAALPRERRKGEATVAYDLRPLIDAIEVRPAAGGDVVVRLVLRHDPERGVGRPEEALAALGDQAGAVLETVDLVREGLVLARPPAPVAPPPRGRPGQGRPIRTGPTAR